MIFTVTTSILMKTLLGISSFQMIAMFRRGLFYSYLTIYLRHFLLLSVTETTLFATLPMILNVISQRYLWGAFSDKHQKRRFLIIRGEILGGIGTFLLFYLHLLPDDKRLAGWVIITGLCVIEIFWSMSNIGWSALISDIYPKQDRGKIMGKLESIGGIGRIFGVLAGGLLYDRLGTAFPGWGFYHGSLFFISAAAMFFSVLPMLMVPEGGIKNPDTPSVMYPAAGSYPVIIFRIFIIAMVLINFGRNSIVVTLAQYLTLESGLHLSPITLSHVVNTRSVGIIISGLVTGFLLKRAGVRNLLACGTIAAILSLLILGVADSLFIIGISSFLMGFSEVIIMAASYELASFYIPPEKRGVLFSTFNATFFLSWGMAGTLIAGPITDGLISLGTTESFAYRVSFMIAAGITLLGLGGLMVLYRTEKKKDAP